MRSGGAPGVYSARYAGEGCTEADNRAKLLAELASAGAADDESRTAHFRTVALVAWPDGREIVADGVCDGTIAGHERGARGFGYDPVFVPSDGDGRTFAEMTEDEKHSAVAPRPGVPRFLDGSPARVSLPPPDGR